MSLLIDTDAFCKLACGTLLEAVPVLFGFSIEDCARLPALPHMLRRGGLRRRLGDALSDQLLCKCERLKVVPDAPLSWMELLRQHPGIDPGEAHLLALAADRGDFLLTGDKRALREVCRLPELVAKLNGRIATVEAVVTALCERLGDETVREGMAEGVSSDSMLRVCFSPGERAPRSALAVYLRESRSAVTPLVLWGP